MPTVDLSCAKWTKSTRSTANGQCVEVAFAECAVAVRDSTNPDGVVLMFSRQQWNAFLDTLRDGLPWNG